MRISPRDLTSEYVRTKATWPFITEVNESHGLPRWRLLQAVGSRETNLRNIVGTAATDTACSNSMIGGIRFHPGLIKMYKRKPKKPHRY